jgi:hypothetical protein
MVRKALVLVPALLGAGLFVAMGQQPIPAGVFTAAQAEAGRVASESSCGKCHTPALLGRKGDPGELPPLTSLSASYQKFIGPRGFVPPLTGKYFIDRWGSKTRGTIDRAISGDRRFFPVGGRERRDCGQYHRVHPAGKRSESRNPADDQNHRCYCQFVNPVTGH